MIPFGTYDSYCRGFENGNNIVGIGKTAYLINKEGSIIKPLVIGNDKIYCSTDYYGDYLVVNEGTGVGMKYIYDSEGNLFWKGNAVGYRVDHISGTIAMGAGTTNTKVIKETEVPYKW